MIRSTRRSSVAIRRGVLSLVLGVPLLSQPVQAQTSEVGGEPASDETNAEMVEVKQPRVLISEVAIEGLQGLSLIHI